MSEEDVTQREIDGTVELCRQILAAWRDRSTYPQYPARDKISSDAHHPYVYGLVAHTHLLGETVADLVENGDVLQAMPLVRLMYECALTAQWAALTIDAPQAAANEMSRLQRATSLDLADAKTDILREGAGTMPYEDEEQLDSAVDRAARQFKALCTSLEPAGIEAYIYYRLLSDHAHASIRVTDMWLKTPPPDSNVSVIYRLSPEQPDGSAAIGFCLWSLIWAGSAIDYMTAGRPRRRELESFAGKAEIPAMLHLNPKVAQKAFGERKARKEQQRRDVRRRSRSASDQTAPTTDADESR